MYNILEVEDKIKGLPDQALMREAQFPSGDVPQFLIVSELQRRNEMRKSYAATQEPAQTVPVAQQVVAEAGQGLAGMMGGTPMLPPPPMQAQAPMQPQTPMPVAAPMQAQTPMAAPMQSSMPAPAQPPMPRPPAPAGIVGMQSGRTAPNIYDTSLFSERLQDVIDQRPERQRRTFKTPEERRREQEEASRELAQSRRDIELRQQVRRDAVAGGLTIPEASDLADSVYITDEGQVQFPSELDLTRVPSETAARITPYDPFNLQGSLDLPFGRSDPDPTPDPTPDPDELALASYKGQIMDLTKEGRDFIGTTRDELSALKPPKANLTELDFIADDIDRQSYIDRLSNIAGEDIASREVLIDELQEKSKRDALSAFLMSFGAGVAGGDLSGGIEQGSKAAQDVKQIADKRLFDERKAMRDVKSAAEREAVQLGLSAEEAELAGRRAEQKFNADQEALKNTVEFQNYTVSRQQLLDQISGAREDVTTIATLMKNEADIINDAARIREAFAAEAGRERRDIRNYIEEFVKAHRETLEASVVGITDPSSVTNLVDSYRKLLEQEFNLREADDESSPESAVDELVDFSGFSTNRTLPD